VSDQGGAVKPEQGAFEQRALEKGSLRAICVFCGSNLEGGPLHREAAEKLGAAIAQARLGLIYGGGDKGLMGIIARAALANRGSVTGVIPAFLTEREEPLEGISELIVTDTLQERKRTMLERSDAFVVLPGGIGTLDEMVELLTWAQFGLHAKPTILLNVDHFWDLLIKLFEQMRRQGYLPLATDLNLRVEDDVSKVIPHLLGSAGGAPGPIGKGKT
jgi:hypothetical protein